MRALHQDRIVCSYNVRCPPDHIPMMLRVLVSQPWQRESIGREMGATCRVNTARGRVARDCRNRKAIKLLFVPIAVLYEKWEGSSSARYQFYAVLRSWSKGWDGWGVELCRRNAILQSRRNYPGWGENVGRYLWRETNDLSRLLNCAHFSVANGISFQGKPWLISWRKSLATYIAWLSPHVGGTWTEIMQRKCFSIVAGSLTSADL